MRIILHYLFAALTLTLYGGEICPLLNAMPCATMGAVIGLFLTGSLVMRKPILHLCVESSPLIYQPWRQFLTDHAMITAAGLGVLVTNHLAFGIPVASGIKFLVGFLGFGFFISADMALARERAVIEQVKTSPPFLTKPVYLYPRARKFFYIALISTLYVMIIIALIIYQDLELLKSIDPEQIGHLMPETTADIFKEMTFIMAVLLIMAVDIIYSYSKNLRILFTIETGILKAVSRGELSRLVPVATNDEFGIIATYTNTMIYALRDRIRMLSNLKVAQEAQKNLLPGKAPQWPGLDLSGTLIYCEEVGGDHFDFLELPGSRLGVAVTDSSGHGVGSAFHMATTRAFLRFGAEHYQGPSCLVREVNKYLTRDSYDTGRFTSLFFLELDAATRTAAWVRAGHEPAFFYDAGTRSITTLTGEGMALGVAHDLCVNEYQIKGWNQGSVLLIITDGLKETRNASGDMFGEKNIRAVLSETATLTSREIQQQLIKRLNTFRGNVSIEDDITLVVIRLL